MRIKLERRPSPSRMMLVATPIASVLVTMLLGVIIFDFMHLAGPKASEQEQFLKAIQAVKDIFLSPLLLSYKWQDVALKAAPLIIIALGLSVGNRAQIWNIGAEGQYILGALAAAGVGIWAGTAGGFFVILAMVLAGVVCGALYALIPAILKNRWNVNEILSSLMLTYVSFQILSYLVGGPWKDPNGRNFPATAPLSEGQSLPLLFSGTTVHLGIALALILPFVFWLMMSRSVFGYQVRVVGAAPQAARHGGFDAKQTIWIAMLIGGGMAGLAGALEFSGAMKTINLGFPSGYGFTAIIVAFLGRLHPIGCLIAGIVLAVTYVGGQIAQTTVHIPNSTAGIFQAMMLFFILASDILIRYRLRIVTAAKPVVAGE